MDPRTGVAVKHAHSPEMITIGDDNEDPDAARDLLISQLASALERALLLHGTLFAKKNDNTMFQKMMNVLKVRCDDDARWELVKVTFASECYE